MRPFIKSRHWGHFTCSKKINQRALRDSKGEVVTVVNARELKKGKIVINQTVQRVLPYIYADPLIILHTRSHLLMILPFSNSIMIIYKVWIMNELCPVYKGMLDTIIISYKLTTCQLLYLTNTYKHRENYLQ